MTRSEHGVYEEMYPKYGIQSYMDGLDS